MNLTKRILNLLVLLSLVLLTSCSKETELAATPKIDPLTVRAQSITIIRDDFGVPHIYAKTDSFLTFELFSADATNYPKK